jgi:hypothetical protein
MAIIGMVIIALLVLAFVLEPVLRARSDAVVLDTLPLPETSEPEEDEPLDNLVNQDAEDTARVTDDRPTAGRVTMDRAASSDAS